MSANNTKLRIKSEPVEDDEKHSNHGNCDENWLCYEMKEEKKVNSFGCTSQNVMNLDMEIKSEPIEENPQQYDHGKNWLPYEVKKEKRKNYPRASTLSDKVNMIEENYNDHLQNLNNAQDWPANNILNDLLPTTSRISHSQVHPTFENVARRDISEDKESSSSSEPNIDINHEENNSSWNESMELNVYKKQTKKKSYPCELCNIIYSRSDALKRHLKIHSGEKTFRCDVCGKSFIEISTLHGHTRIHTGEKPYECEICRKSFSQSSTLHRHKRIHTGEKPYACDICKKSFSQSSALRQHRRTHTKEKPYACSFCSKSFAQTSTLLVHKRIHTGEKPFRCDICNESFSRSSTFKYHNKITHFQKNT